jgi:hypothetical protein
LFRHLKIALSPAASAGYRLASSNKVRAMDAGVVGVSMEGEEVVISLGKALTLDSSYQVSWQGDWEN